MLDTQRIEKVADTHPELLRLVLFGSRARNDHGPNSDYDFFAEFDYDLLSWTGYDALIRELESELQASVDLVSGSDIAVRSPILWAQIVEDGVVVYDRKKE